MKSPRDEPKIADMNLDTDKGFQFSLVYAFKWYRDHCTYSEPKKFVREYYKGNPEFVAKVRYTENLPPTYGYLCRLLSNGLPMNDYIRKKLKEYKKIVDATVIPEKEEEEGIF